MNYHSLTDKMAGRRWRQSSRFAPLGIALIVMACSASSVADPPDDERFAVRQEQVRKMLFDSSLAHKLDRTENEQALDLRRQAIARYEAALTQADAQSRSGELDEAMSLMYAAVAAAQTKAQTNEKLAREYGQRRQSVEALLTAHERVSAEKGAGKDRSRLATEVETLVAEADALLQEGEAFAARTVLDGAYEKIKLALEKLRRGDTLVRELKFDTPEDEYLYELDRNDAHHMLVQVLLAEKMQDPKVLERIEPFIASANEHRAVAERLADQGDFESAMKSLESSTRELVRAIRGAGIYIPG